MRLQPEGAAFSMDLVRLVDAVVGRLIRRADADPVPGVATPPPSPAHLHSEVHT
jgi:hypothetical protein